MVRLEWAHIEAFDEAAEKPLEPEDLVEVGPRLRLALQPHVRLLHLAYPVDELRLRIGGGNEHATASNAVTESHPAGARPAAKRLKPREVFVAVHRLDDGVFYRRLEPEEFRILTAFRSGATLAKAVGGGDADARIEEWFAAWAELGWLCRRE